MLTNNYTTSAGNYPATGTNPLPGDPKQSVPSENNEIVNEEDQNQVTNAQPVEDFVSDYTYNNTGNSRNNSGENTGNSSPTNDITDKDDYSSRSDIQVDSDDNFLNAQTPL